MRSVIGQAFDRCDRSIDRRDLRLAGPSRLAANVYRTGATLSDAASELRSLHAENVSQYPKKGHIWWYVNRFGLPIYRQFVGHIIDLLEKRIERQSSGHRYNQPTGNCLAGRLSPFRVGDQLFE